LYNGLEKPKLFRDPVHGFIKIQRGLLLNLIECREFQRLRRIRQLGTTPATYHGAEHSRFGHSLGVMHLFCKLASHLREIGFPLNEEQLLVGKISALLHDIGHGPFSHALEGFLVEGRKHEYWSCEILRGDTEVFKKLSEFDPSLPGKVVEAISGNPRWKLIKNVISSQLDVDRMDYLQRDSIMTGTTYGKFDLDRLLEMLTICGENLVVESKALPVAEQFVFSRYYAYWQIYFHKTTRGLEKLLQATWKRAQYLYQNSELPASEIPRMLLPFLSGASSLQAYIDLDDSDLLHAVKLWSYADDVVLRDFALRVLNRRLFKPVAVPENAPFDFSEKVKDILKKCGYDPRYYLLQDRTSDVAYDYYTQDEEGQKPSILVLNEHGNPVEISKISAPIRSIAGKRQVGVYIYVPDEECRKEIVMEINKLR